MLRARRTAELAGFPDPAGHATAAGVRLRRLRGSDHRRDPGLASRLGALSRRMPRRRDAGPGLRASPASSSTSRRTQRRRRRARVRARPHPPGGRRRLDGRSTSRRRRRCWLDVATLSQLAARRTTDGSSRCGTRRDSARACAQGPGPAANAGQPREHEVGRRRDLRAVAVPLAGVDQQHLAGADLGPHSSPSSKCSVPTVTISATGIALRCSGTSWPGLEAQPDHAHRAAVARSARSRWRDVARPGPALTSHISCSAAAASPLARQ